MTIEEALHWIAELFEEPEGTITPETMRDDVPAWDSLGDLNLIASLDEKCGIVLSGDDVYTMSKIGDLLETLRKNGVLS